MRYKWNKSPSCVAFYPFFFDWHKCRLDCLGQIIRALFAVKTINLTQIATAFQSRVKEESSYRGVRRFFSEFTIDMSLIVPLILTMFGCLRTRGFWMEDTHISDPDKIEKVMFVLSIAFCWAYRIGEIKERGSPIAIMGHGRRARSLFREGLNLIRRAILRRWLGRKLRQLLRCFTDLKPTGYAL